MNNTGSLAVPKGTLLCGDVGNVRFYGLYQYSWELRKMCVHSCYTDIEFPVDIMDHIGVVPWDEIESVPWLELNSYVKKYLTQNDSST